MLIFTVKGPSSGATFSVCRHVGRMHRTFITVSLAESASICARIKCTKAFCKRSDAKGRGKGILLAGELLAC
eukprot:3813526-Pleurochrysis_carterae.AAC.2